MFTRFEKGLFFANVLIGLMFLTTGQDFSILPLLGFIASVSNTMCVILVAKRKISNYWWGAVGVLSYAIVAFNFGNTGEWTLNLFYYLPMNFIGLFMWRKVSDNKVDVESKKMTFKQSIIVYSITAIGVFMFAYLISLSTLQIWFYGNVADFGFNKYFVDSLSTTLSITAMVLMVKCYREQWVLWIIVDIASIILWCFTFDLMMILLWSTLLINAVYGFIKWKVEVK